MDLLSPRLLYMLLVLLSFHGAKSTFSPSGSVTIDCGGQQTFTCTVAGNGPAAWTIAGIQRITAGATNGVTAGIINARITSAEAMAGATSTITITGFTTADNGGTVQCVDQAVTEEGSATVVVASNTLASATTVMANVVDQCSANLTWSEPSDPSATTSVSCPPLSPQCSSCTSSGCTIGGLTPSTSNIFSVTRSRSGCDDSTAVSNAVMSGGPPQCGTVGVVIGNDSCPYFTFTPQGSVLPSTVVVSYQLVGDPSPGGSLNCDYPIDPRICRMIVSGGTYTVRATPQNSCGSPSSACSPITEIIPAGCEVGKNSPDPDSTPLIGGVIGGVAAVVIIVVLGYFITILIMSCTCFAYLGFVALLKCLCCPCCKGKAMKSSSKQRIDSASPVTPPAQPPAPNPADVYADPQAIRDRKEKGKEDKDMIQYAAIDFSAGAGSGAGEVKIHQKEEPVIYTAVQHV